MDISALLRSALDQLPDGIVVLDDENRMAFANRSALKLHRPGTSCRNRGASSSTIRIPLTDDAGYQLGTLSSALYLDAVVQAVRHHHERYDGHGYPDGLSGTDIPVTARIIAVADSFDAMTSDRPYRKAMHTLEAADEIARNSGTQFDPEWATALLGLIESAKLTQ